MNNNILPIEISVYKHNLLYFIYGMIIGSSGFVAASSVSRTFKFEYLIFYVELISGIILIYLIFYLFFGVKKYIFQDDKIIICYFFGKIKVINALQLTKIATDKQFYLRKIINISWKKDIRSSTKMFYIGEKSLGMPFDHAYNIFKSLYKK